jgi:hypothetical protein
MALSEEEREVIRQRLIANVDEIRRKMEGVTEEEILAALRDLRSDRGGVPVART